MTWTKYAIAFMMLRVLGLIVTYGFERLQHLLPWNPEHLAAVPLHLALNTAPSFATNTSARPQRIIRFRGSRAPAV